MKKSQRMKNIIGIVKLFEARELTVDVATALCKKEFQVMRLEDLST